MIQIGSVSHLNDYPNFDEVWMIVRSLKAIPNYESGDVIHVPILSPSTELFHQYLFWKNEGNWNEEIFQEKYVPAFLEEMKSPDAQNMLNVLLNKGKEKNILLLCYCQEEKMCHRSIILGLIQGMAKERGIDIECIGNGYSGDDYSRYYKDEKNFYLLVAGSRNYNNYSEFTKSMDILLKTQVSMGKEIVIVSGGARGADFLAEKYAKDKGYKVKVFKANWDLYGKSAGYKRNAEMHDFLSKQQSRGCVCFWDMNSPGTKNNFGLCQKNKTPLRVFSITEHRFLKNSEIQQHVN